MREDQDARYREAAAAYGGALHRLARAVEINPERRLDLLQDMHVALWRSLAAFDKRCAMRTWVYRVAHNVAATHVDRERRTPRGQMGLDDIAHLPDVHDVGGDLEKTDALARLMTLLRTLKMPDRQIMALYLEGLDAAAIADVTGLSSGAVATRISRLKAHLARTFRENTDA